MGEDDQKGAAPPAEGAEVAPPIVPSAHEDEQVDIHKAKPVHSWREFLNEIGVIVIGVLIALGAEQVVESLHWRHVLAETRDALQENSEDLYAALLSRTDMQDCVDRRLAEIRTVLDRHDKGQRTTLQGPIGGPTASVFDLSVFDMAIADQAFVHMSLAEQKVYFDRAGSYRLFAATVESERNTWVTLQGLNHAETLTSLDWSDIRKAYDRALDQNATLSGDLRSDAPGDWLTPFKNLPRPRDYSLRSIPRVQRLCKPAIS